MKVSGPEPGGRRTQHRAQQCRAAAAWTAHGQDPREKLIVFSDGLDVEEIESLHARFAGRVRLTYGWGTLLTNDFSGLVEGDALAPFSLVCKAVEADGRPTVKLSDNGQLRGRSRSLAASWPLDHLWWSYSSAADFL